jgi:YD repeat-containing protein
LSKERSSYQYDPSDEIMAQTGGFLLCRGGRDYSFGASGHLLEIHENGREIVRYCRDNDRLVQIRFDSGRAYDIRYDQAVPARIIEIGISDGCTIRYFYDQLGYLIRCAKGDSDAESYAYDGQGRLAEVYDHAGRVISRNAYNDVGELLRAPSDLVTSPSGGRVLRSFEQNRLMSATDEAGVTLRFQYGGKGEVSAVHVGNRCGRGWRLTYDSTGRLRSLQDPHGRTALLSCDASGRQIEFTGPQGDSRSFHVDEHGRLVAIVEPDGCRWSAEYDSAGRLCSVRGATGEQWDYRYAGQMLLGVRGTAGTVRVRPRRNSLAVRAIASGGAWRESVFDRSGRLTRHQTSGAKPVRLQYSPEGNCFSVRSEAGMVWYVIDESELTVSIAFDDG